MSFSNSSCSTFAIYDTVSMWKRTSVHHTHLGHNNKRYSRALPSTPMCSSPPVNFSDILSVTNLPLPTTLSSNHHQAQTSSWDGLGTLSKRCFTYDKPLLEVMIATLPKGGLLLGLLPGTLCLLGLLSASSQAYKAARFLWQVRGGIITSSSFISVSENWRNWIKQHHKEEKASEKEMYDKKCVFWLSPRTVYRVCFVLGFPQGSN